MKKLGKSIYLLIAVLLLTWASCKTDKIKPVSEAFKNIDGSWRIIKATRNGSDILGIVDTNYYKFSAFRVNFKGNTYTLTNPLPFIVSQNGTFALDNPQYPFKIAFTATGSPAVSTAFTYPIVNGVRTLTLVFSPGCAQNIYSYTLLKVN